MIVPILKFDLMLICDGADCFGHAEFYSVSFKGKPSPEKDEFARSEARKKAGWERIGPPGSDVCGDYCPKCAAKWL